MTNKIIKFLPWLIFIAALFLKESKYLYIVVGAASALLVTLNILESTGNSAEEKLIMLRELLSMDTFVPDTEFTLTRLGYLEESQYGSKIHVYKVHMKLYPDKSVEIIALDDNFYEDGRYSKFGKKIRTCSTF